MNDIDVALGCADSNFTKASVTGVLAAEVRRLREENERLRKVMAELADDLAIEIDQNYPPESRVYPSEQRRYEGEMVIVNRARALLQSATQSGSDPVAHHPV